MRVGHLRRRVRVRRHLRHERLRNGGDLPGGRVGRGPLLDGKRVLVHDGRVLHLPVTSRAVCKMVWGTHFFQPTGPLFAPKPVAVAACFARGTMLAKVTS